MRLRSRNLCCAFCLATGWICSAALGADDAALPPISVLRAKYIENLTSVYSLQLEMTETLVELRPMPEGMLPPGLDPTLVKRDRFLRSGNKVARSFESISRSGNNVGRSWAAFDGTFYSNWRHSVRATPGREEVPHGGISMGRPSELNDFSIDTLTGADLSPGQSLDRLLQAPESRVLGFDDVQGRRCVKVELAPFAPYPNDPQTLRQFTVWFDPAAGYLPRLARVLDSRNPEWVGSREVFQFVRIETPGELPVWLPASGVFRPFGGYNEWRMEFSNVVVNEPIPDRSFQPEFPFGTYVVDQRRGAPAPRYYAGGAAGERKYRELDAAHQAAREALKRAAVSSGTRSPGLTRGTWFVVIALFLLLAAASGVALRHRWRSSSLPRIV